MDDIRTKLIDIALEWEKRFSVMPRITSEISEFDAAVLVGCNEEQYVILKRGMTAVTKGFDFIYNKNRYQIKANRPSGKPGSKVTLVSRAKNYDWDLLIWILYDKHFTIQEAWQFDSETYENLFDGEKRLSPDHMRKGKRLK